MSRMILQLLDFTRVRLGGGFPVEPRPTDLRQVCRSVVDELGADVHLEIDGNLVGTWDPDGLAEGLSNIVANAVDYARPGSAIVPQGTPRREREVVVEIVNQGDPISARGPAQFIFEPFHGRKERNNITDRASRSRPLYRQTRSSLRVVARSRGGLLAAQRPS